MKEPFTFMFLAYQAEDLPGEWIAHCLDLDVVTQGEPLLDALESIVDSVSTVLKEGDLSLYKRAPAEDWAVLTRTMEEGDRADLQTILRMAKTTNIIVSGAITLPGRQSVPMARPAKWGIDLLDGGGKHPYKFKRGGLVYPVKAQLATLTFGG